MRKKRVKQILFVTIYPHQGTDSPCYEKCANLSPWSINYPEILPKLPAALEAKVAGLQAELAHVQTENARLQAENAHLQAENAEVWRHLGLNSQNSHKLPNSNGDRKKRIPPALTKG